MLAVLLQNVEKLGQLTGVINLKNKAMDKDKKKYKPHMMYCKDGSATKAMTYKEHLKLKKKGCGHKKFKNGSKKD
jgi:hypothetical protein